MDDDQRTRQRDLREAKVHAICAVLHGMLHQHGLSLTIPTVMRGAEDALTAVERIEECSGPV